MLQKLIFLPFLLTIYFEEINLKNIFEDFSDACKTIFLKCIFKTILFRGTLAVYLFFNH